MAFISQRRVSKTQGWQDVWFFFGGGSGGVGIACTQRGLQSEIIDSSICSKVDVTKRSFLVWLRRQLINSTKATVMLATPCSSFSIAVSRSGRAIRSQMWPRGLPAGLTLAEQTSVDTGNKLLDATIFILRVCVRLKIPAVLEIPRTSYLWWDRRLQQLIAASKATTAHIHQCGFSAHWKKETTFVFFNFERV